MIATTSTPQSSRHTGQPSSPLSQPPSPLSSTKSQASPLSPLLFIDHHHHHDYDIQDNPAAMDLRENCFNRTDECCKDATFSPEAKIILIFTSNHLTRVEISTHLLIWTRGPIEQIFTQTAFVESESTCVCLSKNLPNVCYLKWKSSDNVNNSENLSPLGSLIWTFFFVTTWKYFWQGIQSGGCRMHTSGVVRTFINHRILKHFSKIVIMSRFSN